MPVDLKILLNKKEAIGGICYKGKKYRAGG